jgi:two-component system, sensor histidine kinase and response regulator
MSEEGGVMISPGQMLPGSYDYGLVTVSVLIAVMASYAALDLAGRVTSSRGWARGVWLSGGALAMGIGIWSMHYVGMLAFRLPVPVEYDWPTVLISLLAAVFASAIGLIVVSRRHVSLLRVAIGCVVMGGAIAGMHYIGMAAMRLPAMCHYSAPKVALSIVLAVVVSLVALLLTRHFRDDPTSGGWRKALSAVVMGAGIPAMHYAGMAAVNFTASAGDEGDLSHALSISTLGIVGIVGVTFVLLGFTVTTSYFDRRFTAQVLLNNELAPILLESAPEAIYGIDTTGACIFCNRELLQLTGYKSFAEVKGKDMHSLIHHSRADGSPYPVKECNIYEAFRRGQGTHIDTEVLWRKDGTCFPAEYWSRPIYREGEVIGSVVTFVDITERKQVDAALRESEERFRAVFEGAEIGIAITELEGGKLTANRACQKILGYREEEVQSNLGNSVFYQFTHPQDRERDRLRFQKMLDGECDHLRMEKRYVRGDGKIVWANVELSMLRNVSGKPQFVLETVADVTEVKRAEIELQRAKEAAEAGSEAKSIFLATMSHEIRTPLNGILGMTGLVLDTDLKEEQREHLGLVQLSAESLLTIIDEILDYTKIDAGKLETEAVPFDLREGLAETMKFLSVRAHQKGLELIYDVLPEVPDRLIGDPGRIRQILVNLIGNAIKFTERGEIMLHVGEDSREAAATCLHFTVKDTGVGIPKEKQETIFEPFSQADGSLSRKYGGTGLGLTICKRLATLMGGAIWVESEPGQGSLFHFTIRLPVRHASAQRSETLPWERFRGEAALIVDDNLASRTVLTGMLTRWGMKPVAVAEGGAALQALQRAESAGKPFPLVLLDGQMPGMDGFTLAGLMRKNPALVRGTIMMLTSAGHLSDAARCRELGISAYLVKPIRPEDLLPAITNVLKPAPREKPQLTAPQTLGEIKSRPRVLLAEDNAVNQKLALRLLEKQGYVVTAVGDGREAVAALEKERFDIVLMDVQMPEMDGLEATVAIRERERSVGVHTPIIALTAHALKSDEERCLSAGMDAHTSKPIRTKELFALIEKFLEQASSSNSIEVESKQTLPT